MMRKFWCNGFIVVMVAIVMSSAAIRADILLRTDGGLLDGKVLSQNAREVVFQADGSDAAAAQHVDRAGLARVVITDEHGALILDSSAPATQPSSSRWNVPVEPTAPPVLTGGTQPTYLVIPLHGEVGETVLADALEKSLADAVKRKPTVVVLDINSPGGMVEEAKQIIDVLHRYNKKLRIVALTNQDLSAAAIFSLSVREIYVKSSSTIGAATSYIPGNPNLSAKVEEKMQSAWRAVARNSAEEGKHETLLAEAMIDNDLELHLETVAGKPSVKEGHGNRVLCRKGKILTLTSHEAVECGLAAGEADDVAELGAALKFPNWTEMKGLGTLLADALPKRADAYKADVETIRTRFQRDIATAAASDPSESVTTATRIVRVAPPAQPYIPGRSHVTHSSTHTETVTVTRRRSPARWKPDSLACVLALQQSEADIKDAILLSQAYGRTADVEGLKDALDKISAIRVTIFDNRNKHGQGEIAATPTPPPVPVASPNPGSDAAVTAPEPGAKMPNGNVTTAQLGGAGGGAYTNVAADGKPVIGFRYKLGSWGGREVMRQVDPIVDDSTPSAVDVHEIRAKPGYVVSGMVVNADQTNIVAFRVIFVGYANGHANANSTYQTAWQGSPTGPVTKILAGKGDVIIGTIGRRGMNQDALGLVIKSTTVSAGSEGVSTSSTAKEIPAPAPAKAPLVAGPAPKFGQDIATLKIPNAPASGSIHGVAFNPDRIEFSGRFLKMRQGSQFFPDQELSIALISLKSGEGLDGKVYRFSADHQPGAQAPHVRLSWMEAGAKLPKTVPYMNYTLILEFGKATDGTIPGKIFFIAPDENNSFVAGTFNVVLK